MKPLLVFPKTKPGFIRNFSSTSANRFYFCELENRLICRVSYKAFISFLENLERQFQWLKIVRTKKKNYYSNVWYFNTMNWIEQKHLLEVLHKKDVFKNFVKFTGKHLPLEIPTESPLKMIKNAFYFHLKSFFRSQDI